MTKNFATRTAAITELTGRGWNELSNGNWISRDKLCAAHILSAFGAGVIVQIWAL